MTTKHTAECNFRTIKSLHYGTDESVIDIVYYPCDCQPSEQPKKVKCDKCNGDGFTAEHSQNHGEDGECFECPVQVQCDNCKATGFIESSHPKEDWRDGFRNRCKNVFMTMFQVSGYSNKQFEEKIGYLEYSVSKILEEKLAEQRAKSFDERYVARGVVEENIKSTIRQSVLKEIEEALPKEVENKVKVKRGKDDKEILGYNYVNHSQAKGFNQYRSEVLETIKKLKG